MRSSQLFLEHYDTDKVKNHLLKWYDQVFEPWTGKDVNLLEIGILNGGSLLLWHDYFPRGTITGVDINLPEALQPNDRIRLFKGSQTDTAFLSEVANKVAPDGFDIIIDDASHIGESTKKAFWHLFENHLKPGGIYVIEDWFTGYWDDWPDGKSFKQDISGKPSIRWQILSKLYSFTKKRNLKVPHSLFNFTKHTFNSHSYGMVGFIKQLVDEQGAAAMTKGCSDNPPQRLSKFDGILITPSIVFVKKAAKPRP